MKSQFIDALKRRTPEQEILLNRLIMGGIAGVTCYFAGLNIAVSLAFLVYMIFNGALFLMQRYKVWRPEERWFAAIILDVTMATSTMLAEPEAMSWAYSIMLWMILGNGFRFGLKWLAIASALSVLGFGVVVGTTGYWQSNQILGYGLVAALIAIPAYCSTLVKKLSKAKEQAETASRAKSYFLASVSHELRTPLNAILGYGNHLREMDLTKKQHDMVEASVLAGDHLLKLIEQLIQVAKTETGNTGAKNNLFRPTDVLTEVRDIMAIRAEDKGLTLKLQAEALSDQMVDGPEETVRNILMNLMGNAIKFTESGGVSIRSALVNENGQDMLRLTVSDTGIGIANSVREKIFKPFQQADDSVMNRFGGTGLGLAICRQLTEQVGGTVTVKSEIGLGSAFEVSIPVDITDADTDSEQPPETDNDIRIISLGKLEPELLASAQSAGGYVVRHFPCETIVDLQNALSTDDFESFQIALIDQNLASMIEPEDPVWAQFMDAEIAPVLVADDSALELDEITLRAAFASVIPTTPDFQQLRSAIRIGCSFAKPVSFTQSDEAELPQQITPRSILVADDNRTNRNVLAAILESAGHKVSLVTDGDEALDALEEGGFDILLLDVNMPRLNGIDACTMWRQIEGGRAHLPIIGVTADATSETEERCLGAGMDMRITKPVDAKLLLTVIEQHCSDDPAAEIPDQHGDPLGKIVAIQSAGDTNASPLDSSQLDYLRSIGNADFLGEMIDSFREDIREIIVSTRQAIEDGDVHQFRFCAHAFKSSSNNIGASILAAMGAKLEKITEAEFDEQGADHLVKIESELTRVEGALDVELANITSDTEPTSAVS